MVAFEAIQNEGNARLLNFLEKYRIKPDTYKMYRRIYSCYLSYNKIKAETTRKQFVADDMGVGYNLVNKAVSLMKKEI